MKWCAMLLGIVVTLVALRWSAQHLDNSGLPEAIRRARGFHVLNHHWARIDNWRTDQNTAPCQWVASRDWPLFGGYHVDCIIGGLPQYSFRVSRDFQSITSADAQTRAGIEALKTWTQQKKRWP